MINRDHYAIQTNDFILLGRFGSEGGDFEPCGEEGDLRRFLFSKSSSEEEEEEGVPDATRSEGALRLLVEVKFLL